MRRFVFATVAFASAAAAQDAPEVWTQWSAIHAPDGYVTLSGRRHQAYHRAYACPSAKQAEAVVRAIARVPQRGEYLPAQVAAMEAALARNRCKPAAKGRYRIEAMIGDVMIDRGVEALEVWSALQARDAGGKPIGLLFDSSPYAITD